MCIRPLPPLPSTVGAVVASPLFPNCRQLWSAARCVRTGNRWGKPEAQSWQRCENSRETMADDVSSVYRDKRHPSGWLHTPPPEVLLVLTLCLPQHTAPEVLGVGVCYECGERVIILGCFRFDWIRRRQNICNERKCTRIENDATQSVLFSFYLNGN
jgi:hypothetical protein